MNIFLEANKDHYYYYYYYYYYYLKKNMCRTDQMYKSPYAVIYIAIIKVVFKEGVQGVQTPPPKKNKKFSDFFLK